MWVAFPLISATENSVGDVPNESLSLCKSGTLLAEGSVACSISLPAFCVSCVLDLRRSGVLLETAVSTISRSNRSLFVSSRV